MSMASATPPSGAPAGFLLRLVATIIDNVILVIATYVVLFVLGLFLDVFVATILAYALSAIATVLYWGKLESGPNHATLGKKVMKIKVATDGGGMPDMGTALKRSWVHWLASFLFVLDLLIGTQYILGGIAGLVALVSCIAVGFKANKQGFHDDWAGAQVVRA